MGRKINYMWVIMFVAFLMHTGIFWAVASYRMARLHLTLSQMRENLRMHISVLTYSALFSILFSAVLLTYFVYVRRFQWVNGIFIATVVVAMLLWMLKSYIVNYY